MGLTRPTQWACAAECAGMPTWQAQLERHLLLGSCDETACSIDHNSCHNDCRRVCLPERDPQPRLASDCVAHAGHGNPC